MKYRDTDPAADYFPDGQPLRDGSIGGMTTKHTPGPWTVSGVSVAAAHGGIVAKAAGDDTYEQRCIDARLIAAAPELLAALRELVPIVSAYCATVHDEPSAESLRIARAAIAKAVQS